MSRLLQWTWITVLPLALIPPPARAETATTTRIQITSDPPGATVFLDGSAEQAGATPVTLDLSRGAHRIRLALEGYADEEQSVEVGRNRQTVSFRLTPLARLEVVATEPNVEGATVALNGQVVGTVPWSQEVAPGRHRVQVEQEGFVPFSRWVETTGGQSFTLSIALRPQETTVGTIFVAATVAGAPVLIDGQVQGQTPAVVDVAPGVHQVVVQLPGREPYREEVTVEAGRRVVVQPDFEQPAEPRGMLRVLTEPLGAVVVVDGEELGPSPRDVRDLAPGNHLVEAYDDTGRRATQEVMVEAGRQATLRLTLEQAADTATLRVNAEVPDAWVFLDGRPLGPAPALDTMVTPGEHEVTVRAPGHDEWSQQVELSGGQDLTLEADLRPRGSGGLGRVTVRADVEGAAVIMDGRTMGTTPLENVEVVAGPHTVEIRREGREPYVTNINVVAGQDELVEVSFAQLDAGQRETGAERRGQAQAEEAGPSDGQDDDRPRFALSPLPLPLYALAIDASFGWPFLVGSYRVAMGVHPLVEVSVEARSNVYYTELEAHARTGFRFSRVFGIGGSFDIGGGFGRFDRNALIFGLTLFEGVELGPVALSLRQRLQVFSDFYLDELSRDTSARFFIGLSAEWQIFRMLHVFAVLDYAPGQGPRRVLCGDAWENRGGIKRCPHWMPGDVAIEGRVGLGARFF